MNRPGYVLLLALAGCGKSSAPETSPAPTGSGSVAVAVAADAAEPPDAAAPPARDATIETMLAAGTKCKRFFGSLSSVSCLEMEKVGAYANQNQGSDSVAFTCAAFLADPDANKRFLAAHCIYSMNAVTRTFVLGTGLDAIDREQDGEVLQQIARAISGAEAVSAKLDQRVLTTVDRLAKDPKTEKAAGYLFESLFPQYMVGEGPKPPAAAQARALEALTQHGTQMQHSAFLAIKMLDDKPAACAALRTAIQRAKKSEGPHQGAFGALADIGAPCAADVPAAIEVLLPLIKTADVNHSNVRALDRVFDLGDAIRATMTVAVKTSCRREPAGWDRDDCEKTAKQLGAPRETK